MSLFSSIGKVVSSVAGGIGKAVSFVNDHVLHSKILDIAQDALHFIPGLNITGMVGHAIQGLTRPEDPPSFFQAGSRLFPALADRYNLDDSVRLLPSGSQPPLGGLTNLFPSGFQSIRDILQNIGIPGLEKFGRILTGAQSMLGNINDFIGFTDSILPGDWSAVTNRLSNTEETLGSWAHRIGDIRSWLTDIAGMLGEVTSIAQPSAPTMGGSERPVVVR